MADQIVAKILLLAVGGTLLVLSGLTLAATLVGLAVAAPLYVIFSPVLVPASIATILLLAGFLASAVFLVAAVFVMLWICRCAAGEQLPGAEQLDALGRKVREMKEKAEQYANGTRSQTS